MTRPRLPAPWRNVSSCSWGMRRVRLARRLDWEELDGLKKLYQAQADRRFIPQSQLWQGEDRPEDRRGDSAFLI